MLFMSIISIFLIFAAVSIFVQQYQERNFRRVVIAEKLQDYNNHLAEMVDLSDSLSRSQLDTYVRAHSLENLRLTLIDTLGNVVYDNVYADYARLGNHLNRNEVKKALASGQGTVIERESSAANVDYFYSAAYYPKDNIIVRSALPYDEMLAEQLSPGKMYVWFSVAIIAILTIFLIWFVRRIVSRLEHRKALDLLKMRRELTQDISHELKTPITSAMAYLETIISQDNLPPEIVADFQKKSYAQLEQLAALAQDISTINRLDYRPEFYPVEQVDVEKVVRKVVNDVGIHLERHKIKFFSDVPEQTVVEGNENLIYGIFRNLIDNSISYAGDGAVVELMMKDEGAYLKFQFFDDGPGVPYESLKNLFDRFYRVDKGRERSLGSTGLGLSIVKNSVLFHGGTISARNLKTNGLCITFTLSKEHQGGGTSRGDV